MNGELRRQLVAAGYRVTVGNGVYTWDVWASELGGCSLAAKGTTLPPAARGKWVIRDSYGRCLWKQGPYFDDPFAALAYVALQGWL